MVWGIPADKPPENITSFLNNVISGEPLPPQFLNNMISPQAPTPVNTPEPVVPAGFGQFSKAEQQKVESEQVGKSVAEYMKEFEEEARLQEAVHASGVDPRGYSSRATTALKNLLGGKNYAASNVEGTAANEASGIQDDIMTLMDPTAWFQNAVGVTDPGSEKGEFSSQRAPDGKSWEVGKVYTTSDGKMWRFVKRELLNIPGSRNFTRYLNKFDYVGDSKATKNLVDNYAASGKAVGHNVGLFGRK